MNSNIDLQNSTTKVIPKPIPIENSKPTPILKKCVWRPVLDSALVVPWPTMSQDVAEKVLKSVSSILWNFTSHLNSLESKQDAPCKRKTKRKRSHTRCLDDTPSHDLPNTPDTIAMETDIVIETNDGRGVSRPPATRPHDMDALSQTNRVPDITDQMIITSQPTDSKLSMDPTPPMEVNLSDTAIPDPIPIPAIETSTCATDLADGLCTVVGRAKAQDQVIVGIKVITQMLESRIRELQSSTYQSTSKRPIPETTNGSIESNDPPCKGQYIFVCRDDLNPISVVDHLPPMIASLNRMLLLYKSSSSADTIIQSSTCYLVPLPRGSTTKLSLALGIKRTAAVAISGSTLEFTNLIGLIHGSLKPPYPPSLNLPTPTEPGISPPTGYSDTMPIWIPTHIKHYKSTVPLDMKKAKLEKAQRRQERKLRRRMAKSSSHPTPL